MLIRALCWFRYVKQLRAALLELVTHCPRCKGTGVLAIPGATVRCMSCERYRRLVRGNRDAH